MDVRINLFGEAALSDIWMNELFNSINELLLNKLSLFIVIQHNCIVKLLSFCFFGSLRGHILDLLKERKQIY